MTNPNDNSGNPLQALWRRLRGGSEQQEQQEKAEAAAAPEVQEEPELEEVPEEEINSQTDESRKRPLVAVVDDDSEILRYISSELSEHYFVNTYSDGRKAYSGILRDIPDAVVSDVMMPGIDGFKLCAKLKSNPYTNHIPVILLTAKTGEASQVEGLSTGADIYLPKPFSIDVLMLSIRNLLTSRRVLSNKIAGRESGENVIDKVQLTSPDEKLMKRVMAAINKHLSDGEISIEEIAQEIGISRVHLYRKMKELTNQTPRDLIRNLRLEQAERLLREEGQSITEVMYACGFNSLASFSTIFKNRYGMSPREYIKQHQESN